MTQAATFEVMVDGMGRANVVVNGTPVPDGVEGIRLQAAFGQITGLQLFYETGPVRIEGQGIVEVHQVPTALGDLVRKMNPRQIEEKAMENLSWDEDHGLVAKVLQIVAEELDGQASRSD